MKTLCQMMFACLIVGTSLACQRSSSESMTNEVTEAPIVTQVSPVSQPEKAPEQASTPSIKHSSAPETEMLLNYDELLNGEAPASLSDKIEIRNYQFGKTRIEHRPEVQLEVFNVSQSETIQFEIRTLFFRENGSVIDASKWVEASAPPRKSYQYRALTFSPYADKEMVQLRKVKTLPTP